MKRFINALPKYEINDHKKICETTFLLLERYGSINAQDKDDALNLRNPSWLDA